MDCVTATTSAWGESHRLGDENAYLGAQQIVDAVIYVTVAVLGLVHGSAKNTPVFTNSQAHRSVTFHI